MGGMNEKTPQMEGSDEKVTKRVGKKVFTFVKVQGIDGAVRWTRLVPGENYGPFMEVTNQEPPVNNALSSRYYTITVRKEDDSL